MARGIGRPPPVYLTLNKLSYLILSMGKSTQNHMNDLKSLTHVTPKHVFSLSHLANFLISIIALFTNKQTLKFKSCLYNIAFFAAVNHNYNHKQRTMKHRNTQSGSLCSMFIYQLIKKNAYNARSVKPSLLATSPPWPLF